MTSEESLFIFCLKYPGSFTTATLCLSLERIEKKTEPTMNRIIMIGKRKVERIKVRFLTLERYSRCIMIPILLILFFVQYFRLCLMLQWFEILWRLEFPQPV